MTRATLQHIGDELVGSKETMEPYYQDTLTTLYCADNRDIVFPNVDVTITDPPYAEETHRGARTNPVRGHDGASQWATGGNEGRPLIAFDHIGSENLRTAFDRIGRSTRRWVISFMDWRHIYQFEREPPTDLRFVRFGIWVKPNGAPQFTGDRPSTGWEGIAIMHRAGGRMAWNGGGHHAVYTCNIAHQDHRIADNPTAKPMPLIADLIKLYSNPGETIFDPFAGNGTTLAVARLLNRRAIGIEQNEAQCAALVEWLARPVTQRRKRVLLNDAPTLFD
jgi:hypothetical protein